MTVICTCPPSRRAMRFCQPPRAIWLCDKGCGGRRIWAIGDMTVRRADAITASKEFVVAVYVGPDDVRNRIEDFDGNVLSRDQTQITRIFSWYYRLSAEEMATYFIGIDTSRVLAASATE